jgi:hypothetical protein
LAPPQRWGITEYHQLPKLKEEDAKDEKKPKDDKKGGGLDIKTSNNPARGRL